MPKSQVFVLMPFSAKFDDLLTQIKAAATRAGAVAERVDEQLYDEDILNRIVGQIEKADAIVAVMTGKSANVFYEVGIAHALKKHVVLLTNNAEDIPFDLKHCRHVVYGKSRANFGRELTRELKWVLSNPRVSDSYYQEYKDALVQVEAHASGLAPYFTPIASRCFSQWTKFVKALVTDGVEMDGPERLEITRLLVHETKKYRLVERIIGDPAAVHSRDWIAFYDDIGQDSEVEKTWILCAESTDVSSKWDQVAATWKFFKERKFSTRYCPPREVERATGEKAPHYDAVEDYGDYEKLLLLPAGAYASGDKANVLVTTFKTAERMDRRWIGSLIDCSEEIDEEWLNRHHSETPVNLPGSTALAAVAR